MKRVWALVGVFFVGAVLVFFVWNRATVGVDEKIKEALAALPYGWSVTYKAIAYAPSNDRLTMEGVTVAIPLEPPVILSFDKMDVTGIDEATIDALIKGGDVAATDYRPLAKEVTVENVSLRQGDRYSISIDRYTAATVAVKPWPKLRGALTSAQVMTLLHSYSIEREEANRSRGEMKVLSATMKLESASGLSYNVKGSRVERSSWEGMSANTVMTNGITGKEEQIMLRIASGEENNLDYSSFFRYLLNEGDDFLIKGVTSDSFVYRNVFYDLPELLRIEMREFSAKDLLFDDTRMINGKFTASHMVFTAEIDALRNLLQGFGNVPLSPIDSSWSYVYVPASNQSELNDFRIDAPEFGALTLDMAITGWNYVALNEALMKTPDKADQILRESLDGMKLIGLRVRYDDDGLVERALAVLAQKSKNDVAFIRAKIAENILKMGAKLSDGTPRIMRMAEAVSVFVDRPENITVRVSPSQPIPFGNAGVVFFLGKTPDAIVEKMGLDVTVND